MYTLGMDLGASTIKVVRLQDDQIVYQDIRRHYGRILPVLADMLAHACPDGEEWMAMGVTGSNARLLMEAEPTLSYLGDIPAVTEGVKYLVPGAGSVIEIGSQGARFITNLQDKVPDFAVNEHCAGGTGSFFEDQMSRLGMKMEEYSDVVRQARSVPRLSGRCAVFAKTDIIHRQQEGVTTPDILLGLCYAMIRNYKATIVKNLPVKKPVVFTGGVTENAGMEEAITKVFNLSDGELVIPELARYAGAVGVALHARQKVMSELPDYGTVTPEKIVACAPLQDLFFNRAQLIEELEAEEQKNRRKPSALPKLVLKEGTDLSEPAATGVIPSDGCALGIDIGSTSTDLVLTDRRGTIIDFQYLRTAGNPEKAVRNGLATIREKYGEVKFTAVGITGSGRERLGHMMGADAIRDEITAQAKAAAFVDPKVDTVFEIGGQDSKYISIKDGEVCDFMMNKICAAGTGSFVEEQAARMDIPIGEFGPLALSSDNPSELGERCTVFIETAISSAESQGASQADIAAGLCHAIVKNYLHKVVGTKKVGEHIVLQGGVDYNPGIVAAFQSAYGDKVTVSPVFSISGAYGAAILAYEAKGIRVGRAAGHDVAETMGRAEYVGTGADAVANVRPVMYDETGATANIGMEAEATSTFLGFDFPATERNPQEMTEEIRKNRALYKMAGQFSIRGYDATVDPKKKTIGVPLVLVMFKFFTLANEFFKDLGYNVVLSHTSNEETVQLSQQYAQGETCYPVKLVYGHMMDLAKKKVDYIFLPNIHTIKHPHAHAAHNYACPYMQTAAKSVFDSLHLADQGIELLSPVFDLDLGAAAMAKAMIGVGQSLGFSKPRCLKAMVKGGLAVQKNMEDTEKLGAEIMADLKPEDKVLVIITRNYGYADPILNMGIPNILLSKGYKVMTLGYIPGMSLDVSKDYPNMYWPFGDHLLSGAKIVAHHPNLYAVYLTNHGCGPDTLVNHMFREEMGDKPYLQIEVDEQYSAVGIITRIEAFLNSISHRPPVEVPKDFNILDVKMKPANITSKADKSKTLVLPDLGIYSWYLKDYFTQCGFTKFRELPAYSREVLATGRAETNSKEYLPFAAMLGQILTMLPELSKEEQEDLQLLIPFNEGADADGQYARAIRTVLDRKGYGHVGIVAPILETLPVTAEKPELLMQAIVCGDILYSADAHSRETHYRALLDEGDLHDWKDLRRWAKEVSADAAYEKSLGLVGTPDGLTSLNEGILDELEDEGILCRRAPLSEYLLFLWKEASGNASASGRMKEWKKQLLAIHDRLGDRSSFSGDPDRLHKTADQYLADYSGANGRYRYAKALEMGEADSGVMMMAPRYENTAMVLNMRGLHANCKAPVYDLSLDGDFDEAGWEKLRSFLYYCEV